MTILPDRTAAGPVPLVHTLPELAAMALHAEINLTPKPGLVDRLGNGAHRDMDYPLFLASIDAITPWLARFYQLGEHCASQPHGALLAELRQMGLACEQAMFSATGGVNTHKGGIFSLGLLCGAAGRLVAQGTLLSRQRLCSEVASLCQGMVARELTGGGRAITAGEQLFHRFGLTGARGEAQSGFATVRRYVLPLWEQGGGHSERGLHRALLQLMAVNPDTNLVSRGGMAGLRYVQEYARRLLCQGWHKGDLAEMDRQLVARNLSPGGSADLLAIAWILARLPDDNSATDQLVPLQLVAKPASASRQPLTPANSHG